MHKVPYFGANLKLSSDWNLQVRLVDGWLDNVYCCMTRSLLISWKLALWGMSYPGISGIFLTVCDYIGSLLLPNQKTHNQGTDDIRHVGLHYMRMWHFLQCKVTPDKFKAGSCHKLHQLPTKDTKFFLLDLLFEAD